MDEDEKINTSITDRMTLIAQGVCEKMIVSCSDREKDKYNNLQEEVDSLKSAIATGFEKIEKSIKEKEEKKDGKVWDIIQIVTTVILTAVVASKWH